MLTPPCSEPEALSVSEPGDVDESGEEATLTVSSNESASPTHISQLTGGESGESDGKEAALALTAAELEDQFDSQIDREKHPELASILDQINAECREGQAAKTDSVDGLTPEQYHITLAEHFLRPDVSCFVCLATCCLRALHLCTLM